MSSITHVAAINSVLVQQTDNVNPEVGWFALSPLLVLVGAALGLLVVGALTPTWPRGLYAFVTATAAGTAGALAMANWDDISDEGPSTLVAGVLSHDSFAMMATITIVLGVILVTLLTDCFLRGTPADGPEIYALYLVAATGGIVMASANDLIVLFLGLETLSLAMYVLAASNRSSSESAESGLKYFILGGFASAFLLYGIALIYGATGSTNISEMVAALSGNVNEDNDVLALAGIALLVVGLGFKVAAAPFHVWVPDVYQGAPSPVTAFMSSVGKTAAFGALIRVLVVGLPFYRDDWQPIIWVLAVASLVVGSFLATVQDNVKRMLAYSSISHAGFILIGVEAASHGAGQADPGPGVPEVAFYLIVYSVLVIGAISIVALVAGSKSPALSEFEGLAKRNPILASVMTLILLAQAGVPFTSGFWSKFGVVQAALEVESYAIGIIGMIAAVVVAFMYLRVMVTMWLREPATDEPVAVPLPAVVSLSSIAAFTILVGLVPGWLIDAAETTVQFAR